MNTPVKFAVITAAAFSLLSGLAQAQTMGADSTTQTKTGQHTKTTKAVKTHLDHASKPARTTKEKSAAPAKNTVGSADKRFMETIANINLTEVKLGDIAQQKAESADVKSYGARMMKDHQAVQDQLKALADGKGVKLPADMDGSSKSAVARLSKLSGARFDKAYMDQMVAGHKKAANILKSEERRPSTPQDIKDFAKNTLSGVDEHLKMATDLDKTVDMKKTATTTPAKGKNATTKQ